MCLDSTVVTNTVSLTQEVTGLNLFTVITDIFVTEFSDLSKTYLGKTQ